MAHCCMADWRDRGRLESTSQWASMGLSPHGTIRKRFARIKKLNLFYAFTMDGLPDILARDLTREGLGASVTDTPVIGFLESDPARRALDAVVRTEDATGALSEVFGRPYSRSVPAVMVASALSQTWMTEMTAAAATCTCRVTGHSLCSAHATSLLPARVQNPLSSSVTFTTDSEESIMATRARSLAEVRSKTAARRAPRALDAKVRVEKKSATKRKRRQTRRCEEGQESGTKARQCIAKKLGSSVQPRKKPRSRPAIQSRESLASRRSRANSVDGRHGRCETLKEFGETTRRSSAG